MNPCLAGGKGFGFAHKRLKAPETVSSPKEKREVFFGWCAAVFAHLKGLDVGRHGTVWVAFAPSIGETLRVVASAPSVRSEGQSST